MWRFPTGADADAPTCQCHSWRGAAIEHIKEALALVARVGAPAVDWRVYRTAARLHRQPGATDLADACEALGRKSIHRIVSGLPLESRLRETFAKMSATSCRLLRFCRAARLNGFHRCDRREQAFQGGGLQ